LKRKNLSPIEFQAASIPNYTQWMPNRHKIGKGDVYLVGDAAAHVKVSTVGGVVTGLRGALGTVQAIMNGGSSSELEALRQELDRHRLIRWILNRFGQTEYSQLIDLLTPSTKRSLGLFTRDETNKLLRSVIFRQPRLLFLVLQTFLVGLYARPTQIN
jgi:flavin-dependent dehydrogenase